MCIFVANSKGMDIENIKSQMRKGFLEYCTLLIVRKRPSYTSDIIEA
jgi:PadR family transcriptional regulator PadR